MERYGLVLSNFNIVFLNDSGAGVQTLFQTNCMTKPFMIFFAGKRVHTLQWWTI